MEQPGPRANPPEAGRRTRPSRPTVRLAACAVLGAAVLVHGSAGSWKYCGFVLPQAWSVFALAVALVAGRRIPRTAMRWLRWSTLPGMILQQLAYMADHQRGDLLVPIAGPSAWNWPRTPPARLRGTWA